MSDLSKEAQERVATLSDTLRSSRLPRSQDGQSRPSSSSTYSGSQHPTIASSIELAIFDAPIPLTPAQAASVQSSFSRAIGETNLELLILLCHASSPQVDVNAVVDSIPALCYIANAASHTSRKALNMVITLLNAGADVHARSMTRSMNRTALH